MKKTLTAFLILFTYLCFGQSNHFNIKETEPFKDAKKGSLLLDVHQMENGGNIVIRSVKKHFVVSVFTDSYGLKSNVDIERGKFEIYIGSVGTEKVTRFFTVSTEKKEKTIYCYTFDNNRHSLNRKKLFRVANKEKGGISLGWFDLSSRHFQEHQCRVSPDGNYFAITNNVYSKKKSTSEVYVFDVNLNKVFNKEYFNSEDRFYAVDDFAITNEQEVILAGKAYKKGTKDKVKGKTNYAYEIHKLSVSDTDKSVIELDDKFINEVRLAQYDGNIRMLGFYSESSSSQMKGGISYLFSENDITNISPKTTPFPVSVYDDIYGEAKAKRKKKKEKEFGFYYLDYYLMDENGNAFLTAEEYYVTTHTVTNADGRVTTRTVPHYDNILVVKFDPLGNMLWGRNIFKSSNSPSYNAFELDGKLHILLNTGKNISDRSNGRKKVKKNWLEKSALFDIVYDENGKENYELIKENNGKKDFYSPIYGSFDYDKFIMANFSRSKRRFLVLTRK